MQAIGKATLDGVLFRTMDSQSKFRSDNACIAEDYKEAANKEAVAVNYGIIKSMFIARLGQRTGGDRRRVRLV